jgi:hypothetical protein
MVSVTLLTNLASVPMFSVIWVTKVTIFPWLI